MARLRQVNRRAYMNAKMKMSICEGWSHIFLVFFFMLNCCSNHILYWKREVIPCAKINQTLKMSNTHILILKNCPRIVELSNELLYYLKKKIQIGKIIYGDNNVVLIILSTALLYLLY